MIFGINHLFANPPEGGGPVAIIDSEFGDSEQLYRIVAPDPTDIAIISDRLEEVYSENNLLDWYNSLPDPALAAKATAQRLFEAEFSVEDIDETEVDLLVKLPKRTLPLDDIFYAARMLYDTLACRAGIAISEVALILAFNAVEKEGWVDLHGRQYLPSSTHIANVGRVVFD